MGLIEIVCGFILFLRDVSLIFDIGVENTHIG